MRAKIGAATSGLRHLSGRRLQVAVIAGAMVLGLVVLAGAGLVSAFSSPDSPEPVVASESPSAGAGATTSAAVQQSWCVEGISPEGAVTTGGKGDTASAAGVIAALEHAYYVARDANLVRSFAGPGSTLPDAAAIQSAIDGIPAGTEFCATVAPLEQNFYALALRERRPDGQIATYTNRVQVAQDGGRFSVISLSEAK
ncbi:hypothetical protein GS538_09130 [Rhodococcus hoagii]|nr:hypothetical protein [Prescottella equi]